MRRTTVRREDLPPEPDIPELKPSAPDTFINDFGETFPLRRLSFWEWIKLHLGL